MIDVELMIILLFTHWVGDYLLQFNIIAIHKSQDIMWLTVHVLIYTAVIYMAVIFRFTPEEAFYFCVANGLLHFATDFITSKLSSKYKDNPRLFYPIIGFDQLIHTVTLVTTVHLIN